MITVTLFIIAIVIVIFLVMVVALMLSDYNEDNMEDSGDGDRRDDK